MSDFNQPTAPLPSWQPPAGSPVEPQTGIPYAPQQPQRKRSKKKIAAWTVGGLFALGFLGSLGDDPKVAPAAAPASSTTTAPAPSTPVKTMEPTDYATTEAAPSPEPETDSSEYSVVKFGSREEFVVGVDEEPLSVTVGKPVKAACRYSYIGCDKPETGDRVVQVPVTIKNGGKEVLEVSSDQFVIEFADGTRMNHHEGSASSYGPDNTMEYTTKIRPGGTLKTTVVFEATKANTYTVILLTDSYDGDDLRGWTF